MPDTIKRPVHVEREFDFEDSLIVDDEDNLIVTVRARGNGVEDAELAESIALLIAHRR